MRGCGRRTFRRRTMRASARLLRLDELELVAVRVFYERDHGAAALDRARFARDPSAGFSYTLASGGNVGNADRDVAERAAELVPVYAVVVSELEHGRALLVVVADEGERVFLLRPIGRAQELHAEHLGVEVHRALHVSDAQHRVQDSHRLPFMTGRVAAASSRRSRASRNPG